MEKLLIVDGSNLLFQMFYGMPARITGKDGKAIQGTLGFVGALLKIIRRIGPTHVAVLFDGECSNERKKIEPNYKANRVDYSQMEEEDIPFSQLPDIYAALDHLGIRHQETTVCEADDWIAGYAKTGGEGQSVIIVSQDSDFFQLIGERVSVLRYRGEKSVRCDPLYLRERFGIEPEQYAAFKSLTGDTADNIPGVKGIGPKTAAALLRQFGDLETLLSCAEQVERPALRKAILESKDRIRKNERLIRLDGVEDLPFALEDLRYRDAGITTGQVLRAIGLR